LVWTCITPVTEFLFISFSLPLSSSDDSYSDAWISQDDLLISGSLAIHNVTLFPYKQTFISSGIKMKAYLFLAGEGVTT
jgi:hypothetical protein